jgi:hypothetical protein
MTDEERELSCTTRIESRARSPRTDQRRRERTRSRCGVVMREIIGRHERDGVPDRGAPDATLTEMSEPDDDLR